MASDPGQKIMAIPVVKGHSDINERIKYLLGDTTKIKQLEVLENYHFGGYAKKTAVLTGFMNHCWQRFRLPLDFIYTAKMLYAVIDAVKNDHFQKNSNIICIHTGGLQGNHSLPVDTLIY